MRRNQKERSYGGRRCILVFSQGGGSSCLVQGRKLAHLPWHWVAACCVQGSVGWHDSLALQASCLAAAASHFQLSVDRLAILKTRIHQIHPRNPRLPSNISDYRTHSMTLDVLNQAYSSTYIYKVYVPWLEGKRFPVQAVPPVGIAGWSQDIWVQFGKEWNLLKS